jgi:hypothetical protein
MFLTIRVLLSLVVIALASVESSGQQPETPDNNFHIYVLMGQSNMAGRGKITEEYKQVSDPRVFVLTKALEWNVARHPLHFDKPIAGVGPGLRFGIIMANAEPGKKIGLVPAAVGGTSIDLWIPGAYDSLTKTHPYDDAVARISEAMKYGVIKGIIWLQGEADSDSVRSVAYMSKLKDLILRMRSLVNKSDLPFVAGELGEFNPRYREFNHNVLSDLPNQLSQASLAKSQNLLHQGDSIHFDAKSADLYGERFAREMLLLLQIK